MQGLPHGHRRQAARAVLHGAPGAARPLQWPPSRATLACVRMRHSATLGPRAHARLLRTCLAHVSQICPPGTFADRAVGSCKKCAAGTYSSSFGAAACKACPAGTFAPVSGLFACIKVGGGWVRMAHFWEPDSARSIMVSPLQPARGRHARAAAACAGTRLSQINTPHAPLPVARPQCPIGFAATAAGAVKCEYKGFTS